MKEVPGLGTLIAFLVGFALVLFLFLPAHSEALDPIFGAVNQTRIEYHLRPLDLRSELSQVAQAHADDMASRDYLDHVNPEGQSPLSRARAAGLEGFRLLAENIGITSVRPDPHQTVLEHWLVSPEHRENVLHPAFNATGIGVAFTKARRTIYVQLYAAY